jgi:hypothetical protein
MDRFRFVNPKLQDQLRRLCDAAGIKYTVESDGALGSSDEDQAMAESLRSAVRFQRFVGWHTVCLPVPEDAGVRALFDFLEKEGIPFEVEEQDGERSLLLPEDGHVPDSIWEAVYGPVSAFERTPPKCGCCGQEITEASFGEISVRRESESLRAVLYVHTLCLAKHLSSEGRHVLESLG